MKLKLTLCGLPRRLPRGTYWLCSVLQFPAVYGHSLYLFRVWHGAVSFHGGLIGVIVVMIIFARRTKRSFFQVSDFIAPLIPFGFGAGRLGNFINGELWGRVHPNFPFAMLFPGLRTEDILLLQTNPQWQSIFDTYGVLPRHRSQLYELLLERCGAVYHS